MSSIKQVFPTPGLNPRLPHLLCCRRTLYLLSHQGSAKDDISQLNEAIEQKLGVQFHMCISVSQESFC